MVKWASCLLKTIPKNRFYCYYLFCLNFLHSPLGVGQAVGSSLYPWTANHTSTSAAPSECLADFISVFFVFCISLYSVYSCGGTLAIQHTEVRSSWIGFVHVYHPVASWAELDWGTSSYNMFFSLLFLNDGNKGCGNQTWASEISVKKASTGRDVTNLVWWSLGCWQTLPRQGGHGLRLGHPQLPAQPPLRSSLLILLSWHT